MGTDQALKKSDTAKSKPNSIRIKRLVKRGLVKLVFFILLLGFAYVILYPFLFKLTAAFMSYDDLFDPLVSLVPRKWVLDNFKSVFATDNFSTGFFNMAFYALVVGLLSMFSSALVGYGLARYRFPFRRLVTAMVVLTMIVPSQTIRLSLFSEFRYFDIFGLFKLFTGQSLQLTNSIWPFVILSSTCLGFRAGIFVILMRQYYIGIPKEHTEAAYVDGAGPFYTFFRVILPMAKSMLIVIFALAFSWQWTDVFYTGTLNGSTPMLQNIILTMASVTSGGNSDYYYYIVQANTAALIAILPLLLIFVLLQRRIIQGIERSGLVG